MKKIFIILLFLYLFFSASVFAQEISQETVDIQKMVQTAEFDKTNELTAIYQITNDSINRMIGALTFIAGIFAIFITGLVLFFAVKQILADKEIKEYKEAIKQNKIAIEEKTKKTIRGMDIAMTGITKRVQKIREMEQKLKDVSKNQKKGSKNSQHVQNAIDNLKREIEVLKEELNFQKGKISTVSSGYGAETMMGIGSSSTSISPYTTGISTGTLEGTSTSKFCSSLSSNCCDNCSHINEYGAIYCSKCGKPLKS